MKNPVLIFDGVCLLCNKWVQFVLLHDKKEIFRFVSLQSAQGQALMKPLNTNGKTPDSVVLIVDNKYYLESDAALETLKLLGGIWRFSFILKLCPQIIRNYIYRIIARNRYRWFGETEICMVPDPKWADRFL
ncbi:MAG: thiol-disulfide oxidoreductase DCC family protein [Saprospiraceae bacterium]|jgi:predicted DCC family thiol-disulfide oxidoreductase YuxK